MGHFIKKLLFILLFVGVLIAPANAQNEKNMYSYKKIGNKYIVSINNHTEIVKALNAFCKEKGILSGSINGIGAIGELTLRFFNPKTKAYDDKTFREQMEISNLTGNISSGNAPSPVACGQCEACPQSSLYILRNGFACIALPVSCAVALTCWWCLFGRWPKQCLCRTP